MPQVWRCAMNLSDMRKTFSLLRSDTRGVSAMEFALILPVLVLMVVGMADFGRLLLLSHKLQNSAFILADLVGRDQTLSVAQLEDSFLALEQLISPFEFDDNGTAIVSSVSGASGAGDPTINWQRAGAGVLSATSEVGVEGGTATVPDALNVANGETVIVAEVYYAFEPMFGMTTSAQTIRKTAVIRPRLGTLESLQP